jgi:hypothetical protein
LHLLRIFSQKIHYLLCLLNHHNFMTISVIPNHLARLGFLFAIVSFFCPRVCAVDHVIQISVDGLRGDFLQNLVSNAPSSYPNFYRLQTEGAFTYNARCDVSNSSTIPNHTSMVTGRPVLQPEGADNTVSHDITSNSPRPTETFHNSGNTNLAYIFSTFDVAHDRGLLTACYLGKTRLAIVQRSYNSEHGGPDMIGDDNGPDKIDFFVVQDGFSDNLIEAVTRGITNTPVHYTFLHIVEPDIPGGHSFGWGSADWEMWVRETDTYLGRIFAALDTVPALADNMAIILTADHGGGGEVFNNHRDPSFRENYTIPFFVWSPGAGIPAGMDLYDLVINRNDPELTQPSYSDPMQPLWGGDSGNMAMALLGLPSIPGSFLLPELPPSEVMLTIGHQSDAIVLGWPVTIPAQVLESVPTLDISEEWARVDLSEVVSDGQTYSLSIPKTTAVPTRFYRLRQVPFSIASQPMTQTVQAGQNVSFSVGVSGEGTFSYQWFRDGTLLPSETTDTLSLVNVQPGQEGQFRVTVSDGTDTLASEEATLFLVLGPTITQQPVSLVITSGLSATFTIAATGAVPLEFQWKFNGVDIPGANSDFYSIPSIAISNDGDYTVMVTDEFGSVLSEVATLTVLVLPSFVVGPQSQTVTVGDTITFTVTIDGNPPPIGYKWRRDNVTLGFDVSDQLTSSYSITNVQLSDAGRYTVVATNLASTYFPGILSPRGTLTVLEP